MYSSKWLRRRNDNKKSIKFTNRNDTQDSSIQFIKDKFNSTFERMIKTIFIKKEIFKLYFVYFMILFLTIFTLQVFEYRFWRVIKDYYGFIDMLNVTNQQFSKEQNLY